MRRALRDGARRAAALAGMGAPDEVESPLAISTSVARNPHSMFAPQPKRSIFSGLGETFLAVVLGNIIYFAAAPLLPAALQHELFRPDLGLLLDFLVCAAVFYAIRLVRTSALKHQE